jgi:hypothetical protein
MGELDATFRRLGSNRPGASSCCRARPWMLNKGGLPHLPTRERLPALYTSRCFARQVEVSDQLRRTSTLISGAHPAFVGPHHSREQSPENLPVQQPTVLRP